MSANVATTVGLLALLLLTGSAVNSFTYASFFMLHAVSELDLEYVNFSLYGRLKALGSAKEAISSKSRLGW